MLKNWEKYTVSEEVRYDTKNESGTFTCDESGRLKFFWVDSENCLRQGPHGYGGENCMRTLVIPEGVRQIGEPEICHMQDIPLRDLVVVEKLVLPGSLEILGSGILSHCLIMEMELPASLREIGGGALMCSYIHVLRIPQDMPLYSYGWGQKKEDGKMTIYGRQFKETVIDTLIVPRDYPYQDLLREAKINNIVYSDKKRRGPLWKLLP